MENEMIMEVAEEVMPEVCETVTKSNHDRVIGVIAGSLGTLTVIFGKKIVKKLVANRKAKKEAKVVEVAEPEEE